MNKTIIAILATAALAFGFCGYYSKVADYWEGGHRACVYSDGTTRIQLNVSGSEMCPWSIRYDAWTGRICE